MIQPTLLARDRLRATDPMAGDGAERARPRVSVIVPAVNEARNLPFVLPRIPTWVHEVILVDGASSDGTVEIARSLWPDVRVIHRARRGKGDALRAGFRAARGDVIVTLDADGSADPREIPLFVAALANGADFVKGSRFLQGGGTDDMELHRKVGNWMLRASVRVAFGGRYSDLCYGFNAFWRRILPAIDGDANGFEIETMMNVRVLAAGLRVVELPSFEAPRIHGASNLRTFRDGMRVLRVILRERALLGRRYRTARRPPVTPAIGLLPVAGAEEARRGL